MKRFISIATGFMFLLITFFSWSAQVLTDKELGESIINSHMQIVNNIIKKSNLTYRDVEALDGLGFTDLGPVSYAVTGLVPVAVGYSTFPVAWQAAQSGAAYSAEAMKNIFSNQYLATYAPSKRTQSMMTNPRIWGAIAATGTMYALYRIGKYFYKGTPLGYFKKVKAFVDMCDHFDVTKQKFADWNSLQSGLTGLWSSGRDDIIAVYKGLDNLLDQADTAVQVIDKLSNRWSRQFGFETADLDKLKLQIVGHMALPGGRVGRQTDGFRSFIEYNKNKLKPLFDREIKDQIANLRRDLTEVEKARQTKEILELQKQKAQLEHKLTKAKVEKIRQETSVKVWDERMNRLYSMWDFAKTYGIGTVGAGYILYKLHEYLPKFSSSSSSANQ